MSHIYGGRMDARVHELRHSSDRLRDLATRLDDDVLEAQAYPTEWSIAQVLSHIGSGAVIVQRRLDDGLAGRPFPDDFAPGVWDTWNAKPARAMADDALVSDAALVERLEAVSDEDLAAFRFRLGPREFDGPGMIGLRLVTFAPGDGGRDPDLTLPAEAFARLVYGRLDPDHTPAFEGDPDLLAELRRAYPGF